PRHKPFPTKEKVLSLFLWNQFSTNGHAHDQLVSAEPPSLGQPNIEFSCPAASTQNSMELRDCIHGPRRPFRGQLQRFVIHTRTVYKAICQVISISLVVRHGTCTLILRCYPSASTMALGFSAATISSARA